MFKFISELFQSLVKFFKFLFGIYDKPTTVIKTEKEIKAIKQEIKKVENEKSNLESDVDYLNDLDFTNKH